MKKLLLASLIASTALVAPAAQAQDSEVAALRAQIEELQAQIALMSGRLDQMEQTAEAAPAAPVVVAAPPAPAPAATPAPAPAAIAWRGAPEITGEGGWSFKPRGRLQIDAGYVSAPDSITDASLGFGSEMRRAYIGVEGRIPGGFGYRAEVDVAANAVEVTDFYLTYQASPELQVMLGQAKPFWGLEEVTSDLFTSFNERAAINTAFGYERRLGLAATYTSGPVIVQAGVFTDNVADLNNDENNALSFDGRLVFSPRVGSTQLHLGGSVHLRNLNDGGTSARYRVRPFIHSPDIRFIDTGSISATGENGYGLEAAVISGPFHATGEWHWQQVETPGIAANPMFTGGYAEVGYFLTSGDKRGYRNGVFDRTRPAHPVSTGGIGAWQVNLRYDTLELNDGTLRGGSQDGLYASLVWVPTDYTRLIFNYGRVYYDEAVIALPGADRSYSADAFGLRGQIDF